MSFCGSIIREITWLERQSQIVARQICRIEAIETCADWQDDGYNQCVSTRDEGYNRCAATRDEGYSKCCGWWPCSWACDALVWVSNVVCVAWTWVSNIVCVAWNWVSKWVCRVLSWVWKTVCRLVISVVFTFIRRILLQIELLPCRSQTPKLDDRIHHVFVLMLENRSFDHILGATRIEGTDAETGKSTEICRRPEGTSNTIVHADGTTTTCIVGTGQKRSVGKDPGHEFGNTLTALCGSRPRPKAYPPYPHVDNSGFAQNYAATDPENPCTIMLSYRGEDEGDGTADVPVIVALAREFAICDHWFSSMPGPTWPNRLFVHAASAAGLDDSPSVGDELIDELVNGIIFDNGNLFDLVESENIDWAVYHGDAFPQVMALSGMDPGTIATNFHSMDDFEEDLADGSIANYVFIEPDYGDDITGNTYRCGNSQHPLDDITHGERLIKRVYEAIRNSPVWERSMLIVTYDEGGGFFDHVLPGKTVPPGDSTTDPGNNHHDFAFDQLGVRVPAIVCSPWIPRNVIDHREYEHASVPSTVEALWHLPHLTDRDAHARDLTSLLTLLQPRTAPEDAPTALPDAATPEASCPDDPRRRLDAREARMRASRPHSFSERRHARRVAGSLPPRPPRATLIDPQILADAAQTLPRPLTSTAAAFLLVALRRDLLSAPRQERPQILRQVRRFQTIGEAGVYAQRVEQAVMANVSQRRGR